MKIYFNITSNNLNNFPIELFKYYEIYLSPLFNKKENNIFLKKLIIYGIKFIFTKKHINDNFFNVIIKDIINDSYFEYKQIPYIYILDSEYYLCKLCSKCGKIFKKLNTDFELYKDIIYNCNCITNINESNNVSNDIINTYIKKNNINECLNIGSSRDEKFQDSMKKQAIRLEFATKKENYKKHMRQNISLTHTISSSNSNIKEKKINGICKAKTKKGVQCTNKTINGSDFCGIPSHK